MSSEILTAFLGALQASVSVIITISWGVIATQWNLLDQASGKKVSTLCVKLFLPCLLIINIGGQISVDALPRYLPIVVFSLIYNAISITLGLSLVKLLNLPTWTTPACTFNNTISFPLLLIQSLESTGVLDNLLWNDQDTVSAAVTRAKSYFLLNAMIADSLTFGLGPRLLESPCNEDAPDKKEDKLPDDASDETIARHNQEADEEAAETTEETSLLPNKVVGPSVKFSRRMSRLGEHIWQKLPSWLQNLLSAMWSFVSPPLIGASIGLFVGLIPQLKTAFFADTEDGGFFNAWLTKSVENVGELFTSLQVVVVGVKLSQAMLNMKKGEESGPLPWKPMTIIAFVRFIMWPCISIPIVWALASKTSLLSNDPILWFAMMLMPVGPPALKLMALADVAGAEEKEKMSIAKFLTLSYILSPVLTFAVVGAVTAAQDAVKK